MPQTPTSKMAVFVGQLNIILTRLENEPERFRPVSLGAIATALRGIFNNLPEKHQYGQSYRYLRRCIPHMNRRGWMVVNDGPTKRLVRSCRAEQNKDYVFCNDCEKRVACLLKPLPF